MDCTYSTEADSSAAGWAELAGRSLIPAGLNSPELIGAALKHLPGARLLTVRDHEKLCMVLPVAERKLPLPLAANWISAISLNGHPHLDANLAVPALTAFLRDASKPVLLRAVPCEGPFWEALTGAASQLTVIETWKRAGLNITGTYENWFETNFERKRRKEYRRLRSRLAEQGEFKALSFTAGDDPVAWTNEFLRLEAGGWKGQRGTAMNANPAAATALAEASEALARSGKLRFWKLTLDDQVIASLYAIVEGDQAWLGKIAFDERFARFSPGVLLILHATEQLFAEGGIACVDSCAIPDHPMIDSIWRDRLAFADVMVAHATVSSVRFTATLAAERLRRSLRTTARDIFYKLSGRHRS